MVVGFTTTSMQSVPIITEVMSSNPVQDEMYSIQHHVIQFVNDLRQVWFSPGTPVSSTNKTDRHDKTEILLKVALNTITKLNQIIKHISHDGCGAQYKQI
jgi:hypothetical protein